jgi:Zn ribbon nucleic-acid-binding protein
MELCPACNSQLNLAAWKDGNPSDEICPACGIQFGYDDAAGGDPSLRKKIYSFWQQKWEKIGRKPLSKTDKSEVLKQTKS